MQRKGYTEIGKNVVGEKYFVEYTKCMSKRCIVMSYDVNLSLAPHENEISTLFISVLNVFLYYKKNSMSFINSGSTVRLRLLEKCMVVSSEYLFL